MELNPILPQLITDILIFESGMKMPQTWFVKFEETVTAPKKLQKIPQIEFLVT